jgi:hypothetical protein
MDEDDEEMLELEAPRPANTRTSHTLVLFEATCHSRIFGSDICCSRSFGSNTQPPSVEEEKG